MVYSISHAQNCGNKFTLHHHYRWNRRRVPRKVDRWQCLVCLSTARCLALAQRTGTAAWGAVVEGGCCCRRCVCLRQTSFSGRPLSTKFGLSTRSDPKLFLGHRGNTQDVDCEPVCVPKHSPTFGRSVHVSLWLARLKNTLKSTHTHISTQCVRVCVCELLENKGLCEEKPFVCVKLLRRRPIFCVCVYLCASECVSRCVFLVGCVTNTVQKYSLQSCRIAFQVCNIRCQPSC